MKTYPPRIAGKELQLRLDTFGATLIVGTKWCGKTTTTSQKAASILKKQDPDRYESYLATANIKPSLLLKSNNPEL